MISRRNRQFRAADDGVGLKKHEPNLCGDRRQRKSRLQPARKSYLDGLPCLEFRGGIRIAVRPGIGKGPLGHHIDLSWFRAITNQQRPNRDGSAIRAGTDRFRCRNVAQGNPRFGAGDRPEFQQRQQIAPICLRGNILRTPRG
jgi:hypothetical protein